MAPIALQRSPESILNIPPPVKPTMHFSKVWALAFFASLLCLRAGAATIDVGGLKVEDSIAIYNNTLPLNGAGMVMVNGKTPVYAARIYAKQKFSSIEQLFTTPGPKRLIITAMREIDTGPIIKQLNRNVEAVADKNDMARLVPGLMALGKIFGSTKSLKAGESLIFDWAPYAGLVMYLDNKLLGEPFKDPEFFRATMAIWMGEPPADAALRNALLGKQ